MTAATPIADARLILNDSSVSPRWTDTVLLGYLNEGLRKACDVRPDLLLAAGGAMGTFTTLANTGATFPLADSASAPLTAYIAAKALAEDDADKENMARSQARMTEFREWLLGA